MRVEFQPALDLQEYFFNLVRRGESKNMKNGPHGFQIHLNCVYNKVKHDQTNETDWADHKRKNIQFRKVHAEKLLNWVKGRLHCRNSDIIADEEL